MIKRNNSRVSHCLTAGFFLLFLGSFSVQETALAASKIGAQGIVDDSVNALRHFRGGDSRDTIDALLRSAKAVVILPDVIKGGFILAAEGGSGVMLAQDNNAQWSDPAFFRSISGSLGLQAGVSETRILLILMTDKAVEALLEHGGKIGIDLSAAAINEGIDAEVSTTATRRDIYYYAQTKSGLYIGVSVEGSGLQTREKLNQIYYDDAVTPRQIIHDMQPSKKGAVILRGELAAAAARKP